jgi:hypothetical protein
MQAVLLRPLAATSVVASPFQWPALGGSGAGNAPQPVRLLQRMIHHQVLQARTEAVKRTTIVAATIYLLLSAIKIGAGWLGQSQALVATPYPTSCRIS